MKATAKSPITVALVEDDARLRRSITTLLEREKDICCIGSFPDAEAALEALPALLPQVLLMDMNLPGISGVECVRRLSTELPSILILMLTAHEDSDAVFESLAAGAKGYLLKPCRTAELTTAVRDVTTGGSPMTSVIARKVVQFFSRSSTPAVNMEKLSSREEEILENLSQGFSYKEIASRLDVSYATVHTHIRRIYEKLHVHSRTQAVVKFLGGECRTKPS